jgi:hypothetical protein
LEKVARHSVLFLERQDIPMCEERVWSCAIHTIGDDKWMEL